MIIFNSFNLHELTTSQILWSSIDCGDLWRSSCCASGTYRNSHVARLRARLSTHFFLAGSLAVLAFSVVLRSRVLAALALALALARTPHQRNTPAHHTRASHPRTTPAHHTRAPHPHTTPAQHTRLLHPPTAPAHCTRAPHLNLLYNTQI